MDYHLKMLELLERLFQAWWIAAAKTAIKLLPVSHNLLSNPKWLQPGLQKYHMAVRYSLQQSVFLEKFKLVID